jgi:hypothetical protein
MRTILAAFAAIAGLLSFASARTLPQATGVPRLTGHESLQANVSLTETILPDGRRSLVISADSKDVGSITEGRLGSGSDLVFVGPEASSSSLEARDLCGLLPIPRNRLQELIKEHGRRIIVSVVRVEVRLANTKQTPV